MDLFPDLPGSRAPLPNTEAHEDTFAIFWASWPRKEAKAAAFRAWKKLNLTREQAERLAAYVEQRARTDAQWLKGRRFIPHPATFLNGRRWEDEYERAEGSGRPAADRRSAAVQRALDAARRAGGR